MRRLIICQFSAEEAARIDLLWSRVLKQLRKDTAAPALGPVAGSHAQRTRSHRDRSDGQAG